MTKVSAMAEPNGHVTTRECEHCRTYCSQMRWGAWGLLFLFTCGAYGFSWNNKATNQNQFQAGDAKVASELTSVRETALVAKGRSDAMEFTFLKLDRTIDRLGSAVETLDSTVKRMDAKIGK